MVLVATILVNCLSLALQQKKSQRLEAAFWQVPVANFLHNFVVAKFDLDKPLDGEIAADGVGMQCFSYPPAGSAAAHYPFQKNKTYTDPLPFAALTGHKGSLDPNVIVIFSEGTSARLLGSYGSHYGKADPQHRRLGGKVDAG